MLDRFATLFAALLATGSPHECAEDLRVRAPDGVELVGRLHLPDGEGPFPAVVLIHGSEPGRRDSRAYAAIANALTARGIAALSTDKRGCGDSGGEYVEAPDLQVPAGDTVAWVERLVRHAAVDGGRIGVLGWSQGGWIGPLAATRSPAIRFVVSISGPGVSPLEQNIYDKTNRFRAAKPDATDAEIATFEHTIRLVWKYLADGSDRQGAQRAWDAAREEPWFREHYQGPPMMDRETLLRSPRMRHYAAHSTFEPGPVLEAVEVPMLALFGAHDHIVPVQDSVDAMRRAFAKRNRGPLLSCVTFPEADHGIRVRRADDQRVAAPGYPDLVVAWIEAQTGG